jgi:CBS domain-containing protein
MTIAAILKHKGSEVASVAPADTVAEVARQLAARRIGGVVVKEGDRLAGILTERDIVRVIADYGKSALDLPAEHVMTRTIRTASPRTTVEEAMGMMTTGRFRHLPVLDHGELVGIISIGDVVKARIDQQDHEVDSLKAYVAGAA